MENAKDPLAAAPVEPSLVLPAKLQRWRWVDCTPHEGYFEAHADGPWVKHADVLTPAKDAAGAPQVEASAVPEAWLAAFEEFAEFVTVLNKGHAVTSLLAEAFVRNMRATLAAAPPLPQQDVKAVRMLTIGELGEDQFNGHAASVVRGIHKFCEVNNLSLNQPKEG